MRNTLLSLLVLLAGCHHRAVKSTPSPAPVQAGFSRFQLTGPADIVADSVPFGSDTVFLTSLRCTSDTPLVIFKTEGSCVCTTVNLATPTTLKKGQTLRLPIRYNTHQRGPFSQDILVFNNSEINPIVISIKGVIK